MPVPQVTAPTGGVRVGRAQTFALTEEDLEEVREAAARLSTQSAAPSPPPSQAHPAPPSLSLPPLGNGPPRLPVAAAASGVDVDPAADAAGQGDQAAVLVICQIAAKKFHPFLYWATIVASTTAGTTMADFADRSLGIGYAGGSSLLFACVIATLGAWYWSQGSISVATVTTPKVEAFYWVAITFSQASLGTALGDWMADSTGYEHGAFVFGAGLAVLAAAYFFTNISRVILFWAAFILTRPLAPRSAISSTSRSTPAA